MKTYFQTREEAEAACANKDYVVQPRDPSLHCDYACARGGCRRGDCELFQIVPRKDTVQ